MNKEIMSLVDKRTKKALNNAIIEWTSETDIGGDLNLYSMFNQIICSIHISSSCIVFSDKWDDTEETKKQTRIFINNYTGRKNSVSTQQIKSWIKSGCSDTDNYYKESYEIVTN